jgi:acetyltransferase
VRILQEGGVPCFSLPGVAARALSAMARYHRIQQQDSGQVVTFKDAEVQTAAQVLKAAQDNGRSQLSAGEVYTLLEAYHIPVAAWGLADNADDAVKLADEIGYPVVVKADAETLIHKSDAGGVALNLHDGMAVRSAVTVMQSAIDAQGLRFLVQKSEPGGLELILGAKAEPGLGHIIMFGMGGIYVEVLKDVVFQLSPVSDAEARRMLESIRMAPLLSGIRGHKGTDLAGLANLVQRLSQLVTDHPAIQELDLNPIMAFEERLCVVDARIRI